MLTGAELVRTRSPWNTRRVNGEHEPERPVRARDRARTRRAVAVCITMLALSAGTTRAASRHVQETHLTPAQWTAFAGAVTGFIRDTVAFDKAQRRCLLISGAAVRPCRTEADAGLARAYARFRSRVNPVVSSWPGVCHTLGAEVVASLTRSYTFKRSLSSALNLGENKVFAHLEGESLLAQGAALNAFTSMPYQCRG